MTGARATAAATLVRATRAAAALALTAFALLLPPPAAAADATASRVPRPAVVTPAGEKCVEDPATMRRIHMELVKHQRDATVRDGVRTTRYSLAGCVNCHANKDTGRVTGRPDAFCEGCHRYAAVTLDCFECHTDRAASKLSAGGPAATGAPK